ncbi:hypothetical protein ACUHMQ_15980 [Chitinimonas sp. PSY-7]|uniref:hypothetical protein n=1 Tax=Chitinimonas sp. PSY-7 TaxID=3459088 RepID=UPI00403FE64D
MSRLKLAFTLIGLLIAGLAIQRLVDPRAARRQRWAGMVVLLVVGVMAWVMWHGVDINVP